jgi:hypothetical protein
MYYLPLNSANRGPLFDFANLLIFDFINFKVQDLSENLTFILNLFITFIIKPALLISLIVIILTFVPTSSTPKSAVASS